MGKSRKRSSIIIHRMKFAALIATAAATDKSWLVENWWNEAVNVFTFNSQDWASFAAAANTVSEAEWKPLYNYCNTNGDGSISAAELTTCAGEIANYIGVSDQSQNFLYDFGVKYWNTVDADGDGALSYDEYKYTMAGFAAADARVLLKAFDSDNNGKLEGGELTAAKQYVTGMLTSNSWNPSAADIAGVRAAWANAQVDGNDNTASTVELARFLVGTWNVMLQTSKKTTCTQLR